VVDHGLRDLDHLGHVLPLFLDRLVKLLQPVTCIVLFLERLSLVFGAFHHQFTALFESWLELFGQPRLQGFPFFFHFALGVLYFCFNGRPEGFIDFLGIKATL